MFYIVGFKSQKVRRQFRGKRYDRGFVDKFVVFVATSRKSVSTWIGGLLWGAVGAG